MFTAKIKGGDEITVNRDPDSFIWMRYSEISGEYTYQYPDVPAFVTNFKIVGATKHKPDIPVPLPSQTWVILKDSWMCNGLADDFFGLQPGDMVTVTQVEEYEEGDWCAFVKIDERMDVDESIGRVGEEIAFFTNEQVDLKVIAPL